MPTPEEVQRTHHWEQGIAALRDHARMMAEYFKALRSEGFTRAEALAIAINWQTETLRRPADPPAK